MAQTAVAQSNTPNQEQADAGDRITASAPNVAPWHDALAFPPISYQEFLELPRTVRREIVSRNRVLNTDEYNLVMDGLLSTRAVDDSGALSEEAKKVRITSLPLTVATAPATYTLQLRRSPHPFLVACGVEDAVERLTALPISEHELEFARQYHQHVGKPFLNEQLWRWVIDENDGRLPIEVHGVPDGTVMAPGEPLARVEGPSELVAHFEHMFHRVFYESMVATKARAIVEILGDPRRFIEVGLRGAVTDVQHMDALYAAFVGGGIDLTSSMAGAASENLKSGGTIGHRYLQVFHDEDSAFRYAIEGLQSVTLLIDLVDSMKGIEKALALKDEYRESGKSIGVRLDSGGLEGLKEQVRYYLTETNRLGLTDPVKDRLVVEGIDGLSELAAIEQMIITEFGEPARARVVYGAGSLLVSDGATRTHASSGFKQAMFTDTDASLVPTMKPHLTGKNSYPGSVRMVVVDGERRIAQAGEVLSGESRELFVPLLSGDPQRTLRSTAIDARNRAEQSFAEFVRPYGEIERAVPSLGTIGAMRSVFERYEVKHSLN